MSDRRVRELAAALTGDLFGHLNSPRYLQTVVSEVNEPGTYRLNCRLRGRGDHLRLDTQLFDRVAQFCLRSSTTAIWRTLSTGRMMSPSRLLMRSPTGSSEARRLPQFPWRKTKELSNIGF